MSSTIAETYAAIMMTVHMKTTKADQTRTSSIATEQIHQTINPNGQYTGKIMPKKLKQQLDMHSQRLTRLINNATVDGEEGAENLIYMHKWVQLRMDGQQHIDGYIQAVRDYTEDWDAFREEVDELVDGLYSVDLLPVERDDYLKEFGIKFWAKPVTADTSRIVLTGEQAEEFEEEIKQDTYAMFTAIAQRSLDRIDKALETSLKRVQEGKRLSEKTFAELRSDVTLVREYNNPPLDPANPTGETMTVDPGVQRICDTVITVLNGCTFSILTKEQAARDQLALYIHQIRQAIAGQR